LQGTDATLGAMRRALEQPEVRLIHYAGHGAFMGWDGWESGLSLADGTLRVPDILALRRVPPTIVLSGCDTAKTNDRTPIEGLGVGQAFVVAGASAVIASARQVDDGLAQRIMTAVYEVPRSTLDVTAALRDAQIVEARRAPASDWASFRVLVP